MDNETRDKFGEHMQGLVDLQQQIHGLAHRLSNLERAVSRLSHYIGEASVTEATQDDLFEDALYVD